jgi:hypothetical protein
MTFRNVFQLWFWADLILLLGGIIFALVISSGDLNVIGFVLLVAVYGVAVSLPSLIAMLIFHSVYYRKGRDTANYVQVYIIVILVINVLYLLVSYFFYEDMGASFDFVYIGTTVAGLISLFIVDKRIKKAEPILVEEGEKIK